VRERGVAARRARSVESRKRSLLLLGSPGSQRLRIHGWKNVFHLPSLMRHV